MDVQSWAVPCASGLIAIGMSLATVDGFAQDADELNDRVRSVEVKQAGEESTKVMVKQNTERLERLEDIMEKLAEQQVKTLQNQAIMCERLDANCK